VGVSCCGPKGYRSIFGARLAERDARRYRHRGLTGTAKWLAAALRGGDVSGRRLLEVGGGVGALQIELVEAGAVQAVNVEIVDSYEAVAESLIAEHGLEGRVERLVDDFVIHSERVSAADVVILHRVICCYPDADGMVAAACAHARERLAITIPRETAWTRLGVWSMNGWFRLRRLAFRAYVHPPGRVYATASALGFRLALHDHGLIWESAILEHASASAE
jgi:hypothetical protein